MDQSQNTLGMLDLMQQPAFCVQNGRIIKANPAAAAFLIETGIPVQQLLCTGAEEYAAFSDGCLYLTLCIAGHDIGASVSKIGPFDVFMLEQDETDSQLQALALAARELRGPLSNVMTVADRLFPEIDGADTKKHEQVSQLNRGLFQILRIIGNMSDAAVYTADTGARLEIVDICAVLDDVFQRAAALTGHTEVTLNYTGCSEQIYTQADAQKIERMVFNIISNALKFTPASGTVTAKLTRRGTRMYLSISDNGSGIDEGLRCGIFTRYARQPGLEDSRYGLGLGMVMIRATAALHGGTVLVDHPDGCGTRITVSLAIRQGNATLRSPRIRVDYAGERDHGLIELSDVLPAHLYDPDIVN